MKKSTYSRRNSTVSALRKSQAMMVDACVRRNSAQVGPIVAGPFDAVAQNGSSTSETRAS